MGIAQPTATQLIDYTEPNFWVNTTELTFELQPESTLVTARLELERNTKRPANSPLELDGHELELISVSVNGNTLSADQYQLSDEQLIIPNLPDSAVLETKVKINPANNTALDGLYRSGGMYCTQCEAQGFRRITFYPDRPDVMSVFTTHIVADAKINPVMLSNGNLVSGEETAGVRTVTWHDPHKKPSYLFALVAGDLLVKEDRFVTQSGREVALKLYVEPQNIDKTDYALDALKRSMRWDEEVYGREYDLDIFMIVAVDDFNMGAMENKGLNIFNSSCVLANPATATDTAYQRIESIVAHEYFHNWSGNRVTCRDWFQLSLKEGFTVFRDASFSADMNSAVVKRIEDATLMRTAQFAEDAGPMAHPVQPDSYIEISNFYTMTIYEKGAEVVRMLNKIVGAEGFRKGSDLYFERHDGQAVTIHEFVGAMEDANNIDLTLFKRWYKQAGTPLVQASTEYNTSTQQLKLTLTQQCPDTPGQTNKLPMWLPVQLGLIAENGQDIPIQVEPANAWNDASQVLHFTEQEQQFVFSNVPSNVRLSLFRDFSAPIKLEYDQSDDDLLFLLEHDSDGFNQWDAGQKLMLRWVQQAQSGVFELSDQAKQGLKNLLSRSDLDGDLVAYLLKVPSESYIAEFSESIDPIAIHQAREKVVGALASALELEFKNCYERLNIKQEYAPVHKQMASRSLKNLCLSYWAKASAEGVQQAEQQYNESDNMTDQISALTILVNEANKDQAQIVLDKFYQQWQHDSLVVNQWFSVQAGSTALGTVSHINELLAHSAFDWRNPNKIRAVLGAFANQSLVNFHQMNGEGYEVLKDAILRLNKANPQIASRLITPLTRWKRFVPAHSKLMKEQLETILNSGELSKDVYEVVSKSLI